MIRKVLTQQFSTFNIVNSINAAKQAITAPLKHAKLYMAPGSRRISRTENPTSNAFDERSAEWQALFTHSPFETQIFNFLSAVHLGNFGTVDNPNVVFTADLPFRYVGCTGQTNEEDYETHELMWFMLREGSLQRCGICGQVFKLVRLRDERSAEMDYYMSNFHAYDERAMMRKQYKMWFNLYKGLTEYQPSTQMRMSGMVFNMVNPDQHDRILTDPAYRMQRLTEIDNKSNLYLHAVKQIQQQQEAQKKTRTPISKVDYQNLVQIQLAIKKLDRHFRKVAKFESRKYVDPENHERREKRMLEREKQRWDGAYTLYSGSLTEEEQKYRDYFETDLQNFKEDERVEQQLDRDELLSEPRYNLNRFDFQEMYVHGAEDDQSSYVEKKAFKFKYRRALDDATTFGRRNQRMIERQSQRFQENNVKDLITNFAKDPKQYENEYLDMVQSEAKKLYVDYFETDDKEGLDFLVDAELSAFGGIYENFQLAKVDRSALQTFKAPETDPQNGWWGNLNILLEQAKNVTPQAHKLANDNTVNTLLTEQQLKQIEEQKLLSKKK